MENRFNNRDFEQFVKQNADQYRMFPSEKVWNNIHNTLHTRRRWYGIGIALLLISVTAVTYVMVNHPGKNQPLAQSLPAVQLNKEITTSSTVKDVFIAPVKPTKKNIETSYTADENMPPLAFLSNFGSQSEIESEEPALTDNTIEQAAPVVTRQKETVMSGQEVAHHRNIAMSSKPATIVIIPAEPTKPALNFINDNSIDEEKTAVSTEQRSAPADNNNLMTIESVVNSYKHNSKGKRLTLQLYVTPTISYRDLKENKAFISGVQARNNTTPLANVYVPDVNNIVTHKPDLGFQLGLTAGYPLSKRITLTGGLQFTVSKYDIKAYSHPREEATITLSNSYGGSNSVSAYTSYRNFGGFKANWLRNLYLSASAPIGLEVKVISNKKGYLGVGGNIQPTYVLDNRSYLLSTDYKNYAEMPSLIRKWNINTGFEIFAANNTGKIKWRIGPQVRYQTMSSFKNKYPVKEHLFDFGLKLGVMLR
ncbi:MAG: hypothetical protein JNM19_03620 [Chitinophagaceae bacterium]|nr:hypothetical protein [Chitinophagaceae bacterium]